MTRTQFQALRDEWLAKADALARQRGERDIETPQGNLRGNGRKIEGRAVGATEFLAHCHEDGSFEQATAKRRFLHSYQFASEQQRAMWELHCEGVSGHEMSRRLGRNRKTIEKWLRKCTDAFQKRDARKPGRPRNEHSLRSEGIRLEVRLTARATLALDHIRNVLKLNPADLIREHLEEVARKIRYVP